MTPDEIPTPAELQAARTYLRESWQEMSGEQQDELIASGWHPGPPEGDFAWVAEIEQENRSGDVSFRDIERLCNSVRRLTEGLRELLDAFPMADPYGSLWEDYRKAQDKARALLSASPSDGVGA